MEATDISLEIPAPTMHTLAVSSPRPGVVRVTSMLSSSCYRPDWDENALAARLQFPGVSARDFAVRRFDASRGIVDIDFTPAQDNVITRRWLESVEVGSVTRLAGVDSDNLPNFASGRRVLLFADESSVAAVHSILSKWPPSARGTVWIDTPHPADVANLPDVDGVGVVSFHVEMGFDPLVTAARRVELDSTTTVWAAGERGRMDAIRATCHAAGLSPNDIRVFGYWSAGRKLQHV